MKNMNSIFKLLVFINLIFFFASCKVQRSVDSKIMSINGAGVIQKPVIVDLIVNEKKATGQAVNKAGDDIGITKNEAVADLLKNAGGDVLVEPTFSYEKTNGKTAVTVTGWPASYINFRSIKQDDIPFLEVTAKQDAKIYKPAEMKKKGGSAIAVILILGLLGGLAAVFSGGGN